MLLSLLRRCLLVLVALAISACGGSSGGSTSLSTAIIGMAVNGSTLYVANADKQVIQALDLTTLAVTTVAGGVGAAGSINANGTAARFYEPFSLVYLAGMLYVTDTYNHGIRTINTTSPQAVATLSGTLGTSGNTATLFNTPKGITTDGTSLFVADSGNLLIRQVNKTSGVIDGATGFPAGTFGYPFAVAATPTYVYVSDSLNNNIRSVKISDGTIAIVAGSSLNSPDSTDAPAGPGTVARFRTPAGIATDGTNIYVADSGNHTIRMIEIASGKVSTIAGLAGTSGSTDGTNGASARFNTPTGLALNADGSVLYVSDQNYTKVRKIALGTAPIAFASVTNTAVSVTTLNAAF